MIRIVKQEIYFSPDEVHEEHPPERQFPLLSAYVCPFCKKILVAYFQGKMSRADIEYYERETPYVFGSVPGGHYIKPRNHQGYYNDSDRCFWAVFTKRGIIKNIRLFVQQYDLSLMLVQPLSEKLGSIPGFFVVEDVCGRDKEILLFSEDKLLGGIREKEGFDAYWKVKSKLGEFIGKLLADLT